MLLTASACDVAWGGASIALENPAPVPEVAADDLTQAENVVEPLPTGDLLYLVRFVDEQGGVRLVAAAVLAGGLPTSMELPQNIDDSYRARFDSAFNAAGRELTLHAGGNRIGSVILDGTNTQPNGTCQSVANGDALLLPGTTSPEYAFAWAGEGASGAAVAHLVLEPDTRMATFGPVLAENLLRRGGETRPYLAQRAELRAVPWVGDERPAMAATYLVNDDLASESPANAASSLFVLARFDRTRGYVPEWYEVRRYGNGRDREAFTYFGAMSSIDWIEADGACSAITLVRPTSSTAF